MKTTDTIKNLISRLSTDDSEAFTTIFDLYFTKVLQFSGYFIKSAETCQEVTSDVFLNIWNNRKKLADVENFDAYIYTVTKNKAFDYLDKLSRQPDFVSDLSLELHTEKLNPETQLISSELEQVLNKSIEDLPSRCKTIFLMAREEGLKYHEIAKLLSISEQTVNSQMVIAIKKLGNAVKRCLLDLILLM